MNNVTLIGNLGKDNDLKFSQSGNAVVNQSLAVKRSFKDKQSGEYITDWINLVLFGKTAENFANFTKKGSKVGIEGRIQTGSYDNKQGTKVYTTDVIVNSFHLLDAREQSQVNNQGQQKSVHNNANNNQYNYGRESGLAEAQRVDIRNDELPF